MTINIHEAKTHFSRILNRVVMGEEIIIAKAGKPIARLSPYTAGGEERVPGQDEGLFTVPEDFDAPLPDDLLAEFYK